MRKAFDAVLSYLSRREHSTYELQEKLKHKGHNYKDIDDAISRAQELNLQSDERFAEIMCRSKAQNGYGPNRIRQILTEKRVAEEIINQVIQAQDNWYEYALQSWQRKYGDRNTYDYQARQKQKRFLQYRGYPFEIINMVVDGEKI